MVIVCHSLPWFALILKAEQTDNFFQDLRGLLKEMVHASVKMLYSFRQDHGLSIFPCFFISKHAKHIELIEQRIAIITNLMFEVHQSLQQKPPEIPEDEWKS